MPPEAKGATAERFPTGEQRPAVRRDTRPEDGNEAPRRRAGEHGGERPEGEGPKEHPQTLPDRPATHQPLFLPYGPLSCFHTRPPSFP